MRRRTISPLYTYNLPLAGGIKPPAKGSHSPPPQAAGQPERFSRHYEERPEIEQDYEQMKSGGWQLKKLSSTRYSEIVFYVLTVVVSDSLYHLFANTQAGARFADKTRQAIAFEQLRTQRTHIIVYAGGYFEIFETLRFVQIVLQLSLPVQEHLRAWLAEHLNQIQKRE